MGTPLEMTVFNNTTSEYLADYGDYSNNTGTQTLTELM